ncbi:transcriptional repressor LexA [Dehalogenimonas etheniformans]|uniref:LexA repressor n=1 Tax=Dehalogenimonas etheniformans TaxID=1536648 RepID=A0A2P5P716_9CHLR|nr:transcriptional repressor LexA [Dehalogenimonas etheniformans]PPD58092.1 transcriptional repressor LexA [Dehalogenimonas etheniformans]QNT77078.1 transcriptional repressor LexA [Dehalogenimonas etheniformans]
MLDTLSARQEKILEFIQNYVKKFGIPPSIRDIVAGCGISSTSVADYNLKHLERLGYIRRHHEISRGIELVDKVNRACPTTVPLMGQIAAGRPIPVPDTETWNASGSAETVEVPQAFVDDRKDVYALKVKGTSMIDALINDGDVVIMQAVQSVDNGEMAAVWLKTEKEATLKRFYKEKRGNKVRLQPANSQMAPIFSEASNVEVQGRVVGVIRKLV